LVDANPTFGGDPMENFRRWNLVAFEYPDGARRRIIDTQLIEYFFALSLCSHGA
jgi:hypothetical protein